MVAFLEFLRMQLVPSFRLSVVSWIWRKPIGSSLPASILPGAVLDLCRSKQELMVENALLRQQLILLRRQVIRPQITRADRALLVLLAGRLRTWKNALFIVQPDTLLRWHRAGFRLFWKRKSRTTSPEPRLPAETVELIKRIAVENRLWGAERIRGELLKLNIRVCKRTSAQCRSTCAKHASSGLQSAQAASPIRTGSHSCTTTLTMPTNWWACDFLPVYDLFFRPLFLFFIIELGTRRVVHFGVTRHPTDVWLAQQLREATPFGQVPRFLIRDNDSKFGERFASVATASGIEVLRTPYKAPKANAMCERFLGSARRECLDHMLIFSEKHLHRVIKEYVQYFNGARPHQGINQSIPTHAMPITIPQIVQLRETSPPPPETGGKVISLPVLGGLHHDYRRAA